MATCDDTPTALAITEFVADMAYVQTWVETESLTATTPQGKNRTTLAGIEYAADSAIANTGWFPTPGSFEDGGTITERNQYLQLVTTVGSDIAGGYSWGGSLPKTVTAGSAPSTTGGTGANAWVYRGESTLRRDLDNVSLISSNIIPPGETLKVTRYYSGGEPVKNLVYFSYSEAQAVTLGIVADGYGNHTDNAGNVLKLIVNDYLDPKCLGLKLDGVSIDDWTPVLNYVIPNSPSYTRGGVNYYKALYPIKFFGCSLVNKTVEQNKIALSTTEMLTGLSISGPECGAGYAVSLSLANENPMLSCFKMVEGLAVNTPVIRLAYCPSHYLGSFGIQGEWATTIGIQRSNSANGVLEYLGLSHNLEGINSLYSGITRASYISASFCSRAGIRNIASGDSDWDFCYLNTNNVDYIGTEFVQGAGITFEGQSSNCNYMGGKNEYNANGLVIIDSLGINVNLVNFDANRLGHIKIYNTAITLPDLAKSINIGGSNRFLSGGQVDAGSQNSHIHIETYGPVDINIGGSFRRGGTLAYDDNAGDATRPVGPLRSCISLIYLGSNTSHDLNLTLSGDANRGAVDYYLSAQSAVACKLNLFGNPTRDLPNNFFGLVVENGITIESKGVIANNGVATITGAKNITSVTRSALGDVDVLFDVDYDDTSYVIIPHSLNTGFVVEAFKSVGGVTFKTKDASGAAVDADFGFICK